MYLYIVYVNYLGHTIRMKPGILDVASDGCF